MKLPYDFYLIFGCREKTNESLEAAFQHVVQLHTINKTIKFLWNILCTENYNYKATT
jgi:hypothetical protein